MRHRRSLMSVERRRRHWSQVSRFARIVAPPAWMMMRRKNGSRVFCSSSSRTGAISATTSRRRRWACHEPYSTIRYHVSHSKWLEHVKKLMWHENKTLPSYFSPAKCLAVDDEVRSFYNGRLPSKPSTHWSQLAFQRFLWGEKGFAIEHSTAIKATKGWERARERECPNNQPFHHPPSNCREVFEIFTCMPHT